MTEQTINTMSVLGTKGQEWLRWAKDKLSQVKEEEVQVLIDRGDEYAFALHCCLQEYRYSVGLPLNKTIATAVIKTANSGLVPEVAAEWASSPDVSKLLERVASIKY